MSFDLKYGQNGIWYGNFSSFNSDLFCHGISTRFGGVSRQDFRSLNLALHNGDEAVDVYENRRRFCRAIGIDHKKIITAQQVHSDTIICVDNTNSGRGLHSYEDAIEGTDALITDTPDLPLMLFFADCVPILFVDPVRKAVGVCHAGWRGTVLKIAAKTVKKMGECFGSKPKDILVGIGPSVGGCCYEVDSPVKEEFTKSFKSSAEILKESGNKWRLDLWRANQLQLDEIGIRAEHIETSQTCTACNADVFYSYRFDHGKTGRIAAVISLKSF